MTALEKNFYELVRDGYKTLDEVPKRLRPVVESELIKNGHMAAEVNK